MRLILAILLFILPGVASAADEPRYKPMPSMPMEEFERLLEKLVEHPPQLTASRLLPYYKIGRCLLEVQGKRLIDGKCAYIIGKDGEFEIHGPRQVYAGIDYPEPDCYCANISTDYFVQVDREILEGGATGPGWTAHWNEDKRATHAQPYLGPVVQRGACFLNDETKICLWKK